MPLRRSQSIQERSSRGALRLRIGEEAATIAPLARPMPPRSLPARPLPAIEVGPAPVARRIESRTRRDKGAMCCGYKLMHCRLPRRCYLAEMFRLHCGVQDVCEGSASIRRQKTMIAKRILTTAAALGTLAVSLAGAT